MVTIPTITTQAVDGWAKYRGVAEMCSFAIPLKNFVIVFLLLSNCPYLTLDI